MSGTYLCKNLGGGHLFKGAYYGETKVSIVPPATYNLIHLGLLIVSHVVVPRP